MTEEEKKTRLAEIEAEMESVKKDIAECKGTDCEVYSRIVGYYRNVRNWNKGKREEYGERRMFVEDDSATMVRLRAACPCGNETAREAHKEETA